MYLYFDKYHNLSISNKKPDSPFLEVASLPGGDGKLCTDLETVWREPYPEEPRPEIPVDIQIKAVTERQDFLEDCIAEMAMKVYE